MNRSLDRQCFIAALSVLICSTGLAAQEAVTVSGHVLTGGGPLQGAHVRIDVMKIDRATDVTGYYSFVIPAANVRGQTVRVTASFSERRAQYFPKSADIALTGGSINQDFDLVPSGGRAIARTPADTTRTRSGVRIPAATFATDTIPFAEVAGATDLPSALAGRFAGLSVTSASALGGSTALTYRGPRSLLGSSQPLFVVDGIPVDNTVFASSAQRYGSGGFDYGSALQALNLDDVASVRWITGPEAAASYGGRGANGVMVVTTKDGGSSPGLAIGASQQITWEQPSRLPSLQNSYGQGLNGKFEFFDGRGGGVNDAVDQNWGPPLDGRPLAQASYIDPHQPDVRLWNAQPNNVSDYFRTGRTASTNASVQDHGDFGSLRVSVGQRDTRGLTPENSLMRRDGRAHFSLNGMGALKISGDIAAAESRNEDAPGTGYNQGNPVSQFTRLGRQVDIDSLRRHVHNATGEQLSWNYAGQNNPFFSSLVNTNHRELNQILGSASVSYTLAPWLTATARGGTDYYHDNRLFTIGSGWMGGFPFFASSGDFSRGGSEGDQIATQQTTGAFRLDGTHSAADGTQWSFGAGADLVNTRQRIHTAGVDSVVDVPVAGAPAGATIPSAVTWTERGRTNAAFGTVGVSYKNGITANATLRQEWTSIITGASASTLYPSVNAAVDLSQAFPGLRADGAIDAVTVRGGWWQAGNTTTPYAVETMYAGRPASGSIAPVGSSLLLPANDIAPEVTTGFQGGANLLAWSRRFDLGLTYYHERTASVILPVADAGSQTFRATNTGVISNQGVEAEAGVRLGDGRRGFGLDLSATASKNSNQVEQLGNGASSLAVGPSQAGLSVEARQGSPLGVLVGEKLLRDKASGALLLRNGLPLADTVTGPQDLGNAQPTSLFGVTGTLRYHWVSLTMVMDAHVGGSIFSTTNLWGDFAGSLAETAFRPDSGLLIAGTDVATGRANAQHVSTQDYYHALAGIQEPWVYSATYLKVRELRFTVEVPTSGVSALPFESARISLVARNPYVWSRIPNVDPEALLSAYSYPGVELGQLPAARTIGIQVSITP
jgi:hypothetical protein